MKHLKSIKGTNLNKGRARTWIEHPQQDLPPAFKRGARINIYFYSDHITIEAHPNGTRKMAGRVKNGRTICILDICYPVSERIKMFNHAPRLNVLVTDTAIRVTA